MSWPRSVSFPALSGVTMRVETGEIVLLRGPNGAGKTTLLRMCAGLVPVVRGTAFVLGHDLSVDRDRVRPHVGLLGHQNGLYGDLTVIENVRFWGATVGATDVEVASAMERMGVAGRLASVSVAQVVSRSEAPDGTRRPRRTAGPTVVARRTPRGSRPGGTRRARRHPA